MSDIYPALVLPPSASSSAPVVDFAFWLVMIISILAFLVVEGVLIYFVVRYRRRKNEAERETPHLTHNTTLEIIWTIVPSLILLVLFYYGYVAIKELRNFPQDSEVIRVVGQKWFWNFYYPYCVEDQASGKKLCISGNTENINPEKGSGQTQLAKQENQFLFRIPKGRNITLQIESQDVIHSLYIPAFRVKQDAVPGLKTRLWFQATELGEFPIFCTEYCGKDHAGMAGKVLVMEPVAFEQWKEAELAKLREKLKTIGQVKDEATLIAEGTRLFTAKGCNACHGLQGNRLVGPPLNGIYGKQEEMQDGSKLTVDDAYLKESILKPMAKIVKGYPPAMPPQNVTEDEVEALVAFLRSLKN
ncbi:MAG: cytochrome c oxidase subunit II [Leptospiraceae bacterium]|nr:cytochrome c oxidase subunit II [Leptospiraceae bacterium]MDW8307005.1 cytochrome c oxidase subunit II [Leptospiraceae bacterium]